MWIGRKTLRKTQDGRCSSLIAGIWINGSFSGAHPPAVDVESEEAHGGGIASSRLAVESMEMGCVLHSIILGIALGMQTQTRTASVLLAVFLVHQLLEALSLGHLIAKRVSNTARKP